MKEKNLNELNGLREFVFNKLEFGDKGQKKGDKLGNLRDQLMILVRDYADLRDNESLRKLESRIPSLFTPNELAQLETAGDRNTAVNIMVLLLTKEYENPSIDNELGEKNENQTYLEKETNRIVKDSGKFDDHPDNIGYQPIQEQLVAGVLAYAFARKMELEDSRLLTTQQTRRYGFQGQSKENKRFLAEERRKGKAELKRTNDEIKFLNDTIKGTAKMLGMNDKDLTNMAIAYRMDKEKEKEQERQNKQNKFKLSPEEMTRVNPKAALEAVTTKAAQEKKTNTIEGPTMSE